VVLQVRSKSHKVGLERKISQWSKVKRCFVGHEQPSPLHSLKQIATVVTKRRNIRVKQTDKVNHYPMERVLAFIIAIISETNKLVKFLFWFVLQAHRRSTFLKSCLSRKSKGVKLYQSHHTLSSPSQTPTVAHLDVVDRSRHILHITT